MIPNPSDVGVIVGRFQVHRLHEAHHALISSVVESHPQTIIVLGLSPAKVSIRNPLDFAARQAMIRDAYPSVTVLYLKDEREDAVWSRKLDELIDGVINPGRTVQLYGGRDSFISHYTGRYPVVTLEPTRYISASELRKDIGRAAKGTEDFRAGVIWASANVYPKVYPTVDIACVKDDDAAQVLLVRKPNETLWRFPGGFVAPTDQTAEMAAARELMEETGVEASDYRYVGSFQVDDWRYRFEADRILTTLFRCVYTFGPVRPADDVAEAMWLPRTADTIRRVVEEHRPLWHAVVSKPLFTVPQGA